MFNVYVSFPHTIRIPFEDKQFPFVSNNLFLVQCVNCKVTFFLVSCSHAFDLINKFRLIVTV